ncbi:hypothetical protein [Yersinia pekkanenii]|uniref:Type IV / VI secretion system DotU domain-containing protein n=1 Tax=Yersinia pekkanenii TaxID=1288385 RepID=A0A0T9Q8U8_9GAMM|nr:hypothetical protein [Yersinia pekkanenii]CNH99539.1 Uncharacterised protein [Yersinia pekkanenii]CRY65041.1 Uncharacterised protein [Yersinia pekkanenii]
MKSAGIFKQILTIDSLLSFNGIIPSLSGFQLKLVTLIEQFCLALKSEQLPPIEVNCLCHQLCHYLDRRTENTVKDKGLSWDGYLLSDYFYGYSTPLPIDSLSLEKLLNSDDKTIYQYAHKILVLTCNLPSCDIKSQQLLARYGHKLSAPSLVVASNDINIESELEEVTPEAEPATADKPMEQHRHWRSLGLPFFALTISLSALWFWCFRNLGALS